MRLYDSETDKLFRIYKGSESRLDWPHGLIMTYCDPDKWWRSVDRWLNVKHKGDKPRLERYLQHLKIDSLEKDLCIQSYHEHNQVIREYSSGRLNFLEINFEQGGGWKKLCGFLEVPVPSMPFPHANKQGYG